MSNSSDFPHMMLETATAGSGHEKHREVKIEVVILLMRSGPWKISSSPWPEER